MSRNDAYCGTCARSEAARLPAGAGFVIAGTVGLSSLLLGIAVWLSGAGLGWAIAVWIGANPLALAIAVVPALTRAAPQPCPPETCTGRDRGHPRSYANV